MSKRMTRSSSKSGKEVAEIPTTSLLKKGQRSEVAPENKSVTSPSSSSSGGQTNKIRTREDLKRLDKEPTTTKNDPPLLNAKWITPKEDKDYYLIDFKRFILEQPDWAKKIQKKKMITEWIKEFKILTKRPTKKKLVENVVQKLKDYLATKKDGSIIEPGTGEGSWQSDALINSDLRDQLVANIKILETSIPKKQIDWNDEKEQVWNLLSPSMYPYVAKRSKVLEYIPSPSIHNFGNSICHYLVGGKTETKEEKDSRGSLINYQPEGDFFSAEEAESLAFQEYGPSMYPRFRETFQWLPSEFEIGQDNSVRIASYINNLHPEVHSGLYSVIEELFREFIPLFEKILNDLQEESVKTKKNEGVEVPEEMPELKLAGKTIQVITKFTNILLTPEKPNYLGEKAPTFFTGKELLNKKIFATGIYYYDCGNVTEPRLEFTEQISGRMITSWGSNQRFQCLQKSGSILTKEGRCVAFPNSIHYALTPFELIDKSKSGWIKTLAFFLVDPTTKRVISTLHVPPQQKSWFVKEIMKGPICFPQEVVEMIVEKLNYPMGFEEAIKNRDMIRKERKPEPF